jgi:tRNA threonylcarbamoyl adenosine modification protein (Sua5/YciO/YrdC/YwlC family)
MLFKINSDNPEMRKIGQIAEILRDGGVIIYPTDSVYALGCDVDQPKAIERICQLRGLKPEKAMLSLICKDISQASEYAAQIDNEIFKLMKEHLPGPYTFILKASRSVPKKFVNRKKTIGVRIPQNNIALSIVEELGRPLMTASLKSDDQILEYFTDPETIYENYKKRVDAVIDGGIGGNEPSTIIDCSGDEPVMIREGAGEI